MQGAQYAAIGQPQAVKVFGIMHVVLGAYGVFALLMAIVVMFGFNPILAFMPKTPAAAAQMEQQAAMQAKMMPVSVIATLLTAVITFLILKAGILMLKRRRNGLLWSNRYAWTSLAGKVFNVGVTVFYTYPLTKELMAATPGAAGMPGVMEGVMIGSMIFGVAITCVYPILTLILLNRPATKTWFANQAE